MKYCHLGHGGGLVVSVPAFYSDDPSWNPAGYLINFLYEKTKKLKRGQGWPICKKMKYCHCSIEIIAAPTKTAMVAAQPQSTSIMIQMSWV